jgi:hypothetical protein
MKILSILEALKLNVGGPGLKLNIGSPPAVKSALAYLHAKLPQSPLNASELLIMGDGDEPIAGIKIWGFKDGLYLGNIRSFASGGGRKALEMIISVADDYHVPVYLSVEPTGKKSLTKQQLMAWYGRHGFVVDKNNPQADSMVLYPSS